MSKVKRKRSIDFKYNLKLYFNLLKPKWYMALLLLILVLFLEAVPVFNNYLIKLVVDDATKFVEGNLLQAALIEALIAIAVIYVSVALVRVVFKFFVIHLLVRLDSDMMVRLRRKFFNHILRLSHNFHASHKTGSMISRLIRSASAIERFTDVLIFNFAPLIFRLAFVVGSLYYFNVASAIIVFCVVIVFILYSFTIQRMQEHPNLEKNEQEDKEKAAIADYMANVDSVKYFGKENSVIARFKKISERTRGKMIKHWDYYRYMDAGHQFIIGLGTFLVIFASIRSILYDGSSVGDLMFIYTTYISIMHPMFSFIHGMKGFYRSMADFEELFQYNKIENEVREHPHAKAYKIKNGEVEFRDLHFGYTKRRNIFRNFNLKIKKNKKVALVGHSGCGKSTLIKLLYRLYDVNCGNVLIDGKDVRLYKKEAVRSEMSIVPQECALFDDTIYNNIAFSNPKAGRKEVLKAIKFAQLDKIIKNFPDGLNTIVGERGVKLSGGEKQRVSIARALLADKKILVLDEATSALDSQTEHDIQQDLEKLMTGRTSIIIAHRLSTIMKADEIIVMEKGKILQRGTHESLIKEEGRYKQLWNLQKGGYIK
ncbi:ABC transporter ATP-binding protein/permease [Candidatus Woesearchaeota archaeon]|nr:ABC transporter ATP-binding protein/permease [Candidatus Woesearchaeota archaeon]